MTEPLETATNQGIYLYCLARPTCLSMLKDLAEQGVSGIDERSAVSAMELDGVVAVIGRVDPTEFGDEHLQTLSWLGPRALRHEAVVEAVLLASPVLPVRFGTIFRCLASLQDLVTRQQETISRALEVLRDKAEWSVKGYLDEEAARQHLAAADLDIQSRLARLSRTPGTRYFQQKQVDAMIDAALRAWVRGASDEVHQALAAHAAESVKLAVPSAAAAGHSAHPFLNDSFLVSQSALSDFCGALADQQRAYSASGLTLELRGPWPAYNFCPTFAGSDEDDS